MITVRFSFPTGAAFDVPIPDSIKIRKNFTLSELANNKAQDTVKFVYNRQVAEFLDCIQELRDWLNKPMQVNSCYRTARYNASCGGSSNSLHLDALALDWGVVHTNAQRENVKKKWREICEKHGKVGGINIYSHGYHLDVNEEKFGYKSFVIRDYRGKKGDW